MTTFPPPSIPTRGTVPLSRADAVARALDAAHDKGYSYGLGKGGRQPAAARPYAALNSTIGAVDCSGFVCWALGMDRLQAVNFAPYWFSTDGIADDAHRGREFFETLPRGVGVLPGDLLVYPDYRLDGKHKEGHVGMIVEVGPEFSRLGKHWWEHLRVAHATPRHRKAYGSVVAVTDARIWRHMGEIVRYKRFAG